MGDTVSTTLRDATTEQLFYVSSTYLIHPKLLHSILFANVSEVVSFCNSLKKDKAFIEYFIWFDWEFHNQQSINAAFYHQ